MYNEEMQCVAPTDVNNSKVEHTNVKKSKKDHLNFTSKYNKYNSGPFLVKFLLLCVSLVVE
jgi:hypothetical protein